MPRSFLDFIFYKSFFFYFFFSIFFFSSFLSRIVFIFLEEASNLSEIVLNTFVDNDVIYSSLVLIMQIFFIYELFTTNLFNFVQT